MTNEEIIAGFEAAKEAYLNSPLWGTFKAEGRTQAECLAMAQAEMRDRSAEMRRWAILKIEAGICKAPTQAQVDSQMMKAGFSSGYRSVDQYNKFDGRKF